MFNNKILILEVQDNYLKATLLFFGEDTSILFDKKIEYKENGVSNLFNFDFSWLKSLRSELKHDYHFNFEIDRTIVIFNSSQVFIDTKEEPLENGDQLLDTDMDKFVSKIEQKINEDYPTQELLDLKINAGVKNINYSYELINREFMTLFIASLNRFGFKNVNFKSYLEIQNDALNDYKNVDKNLVSIDFSDNFFLFSHYVDGELKAIYKKDAGVENILANIANNMSVSREIAEQLFETIATIPPEDVIDNRIIYSKENKTLNHVVSFTKKDLSTYVTEGVNKLFLRFLGDLTELKHTNPKIIFSGKFNDLKGFENYSKNKLDTTNIQMYNKEIIGTTTLDSFILSGAINNLYISMNNKQIYKAQTHKEIVKKNYHQVVGFDFGKRNLFGLVSRFFRYVI